VRRTRCVPVAYVRVFKFVYVVCLPGVYVRVCVIACRRVFKFHRCFPGVGTRRTMQTRPEPPLRRTHSAGRQAPSRHRRGRGERETARVRAVPGSRSGPQGNGREECHSERCVRTYVCVCMVYLCVCVCEYFARGFVCLCDNGMLQWNAIAPFVSPRRNKSNWTNSTSSKPTNAPPSSKHSRK
jgi:hypothetical protein